MQAGLRKPPSDTAPAAATMSIMRAAVPADRSSVTLEMTPGSGASGQITLTAHGLSSLIATLGRVHAAMVEGKPVAPLEQQKVPAVFNPVWRVGPGLVGEASAFTFHHPAYGPVAFLVPIAQVKTMVHALSRQIESAATDRRRPVS